MKVELENASADSREIMLSTVRDLDRLGRKLASEGLITVEGNGYASAALEHVRRIIERRSFSTG